MGEYTINGLMVSPVMKLYCVLYNMKLYTFRLGSHLVVSALSPVWCLVQGSYLISLGSENEII